MKYSKRKVGYILNVVLILLELIGLGVCIVKYKKVDISYYTVDSNLLALITSCIYVVFSFLNKEIKKYVSILKYISTLSLSVTFIVVIFVLAPMYNFAYKYLLFNNELLYYHTLCPIIAIISFVFFEEHEIKGIRDNIRAMYFTICYATILVILNILKYVEGPYPFLLLYQNPIYVSIIWFVIILGGALFISKIIEVFKNKVNLKFKL